MANLKRQVEIPNRPKMTSPVNLWIDWQIDEFRAEPLNPIFRPRVPKPYFPAPGPFKTNRGRV